MELERREGVSKYVSEYVYGAIIFWLQNEIGSFQQ